MQEAPASSRSSRAFRLVVAVVLVGAALKLAAVVVVPMVAGVFLAVLAHPLKRRVAGAMPRRLQWVGVLVAFLAVLLGVSAFASLLALSGREVANALRERRPKIEQAIGDLRGRLERNGVPSSAIPGPAAPRGGAQGAPAGAGAPPAAAPDGAAPAPRTPPGGQGSGGGEAAGGAAKRVGSALLGTIGGLLLALGFCALALAEAGQTKERFTRAVGRDRAPAVLDAVDETTSAFRHYAWVKSLTSLITGTATFLASLALGIPLAWVWGLLAFLLEYVPSVGSVIAIVPPVAMALADGGPTDGLVALLVIGSLQVLLGNIVDPRIEGRLMQISPFGVLLSIVLWGWLWGPAGALLAVPMTVAIVIAARHIPGARGLAALLAGDGVGENGGARDGPPPAARRGR